MARAYAEHSFAAMLVRPRVTRALRVFPFVAETRNAGEHTRTFTFGELLPIHDLIIRQRRPKVGVPFFVLSRRPQHLPQRNLYRLLPWTPAA